MSEFVTGTPVGDRLMRMGIRQWSPDIEGPLSGAYAGMPEYAYHRHPALSSSGAKKLTPPSTPAHYAQWRRDDRVAKRQFEIGRAAHTMVLGTGPTIHVLPEDVTSWQTKAAREERDFARELGRVPVLDREYKELEAMAEEIRRHPVASFLFQRQRYENGRLIDATGEPEVSLFWRDEMAGVDKRCRLDWLSFLLTREGVLLVPDYKTCVSASPEAIDRALRDYGYHQQAQWNTEGIQALGLAGGAPVLFVFVFQEKTAPYLVNVQAVHWQTLQVAERKNHEAVQLFRRCTESGEWPGYGFPIGHAQLPYWELKRELEAMQ